MHTTESAVRDAVRAFIVDNFLYMRPDFVLGDADPLLERGVVDSMGVMEVLHFLEDRFQVVAADDEISEENLNSLDAIARFVITKRAQSRAA